MTEYSTPSPLTKLPLRKFEHFRVTTQDAPPVALHNNGSFVEDIACGVCGDHVSRYKCPRCEIPYCSVACYQSHNNNSDDDDNAGGSCTEGFYQDRVQSILQLERKAKEKDTRDILNRTLGFHRDENLSLEEELANDDDDDDEEMVHQLFEFLAVLERREDGSMARNSSDCDPLHQEISDFLAKSPKLKASFEAAVERGEVLPLVLRPWNPWWRPVLTGANANCDETDEVDEGIASQHNNNKSLDERLLQVKSFESLLGGKQRQNDGPLLPNLTNNLLELLYCIALTLRVFHGCANAISAEDTAVDAALILIRTSSVLSNDSRYETMEEVMISVTERTRTITASNGETTSPPWTVLVDDVAFLVFYRRFIGRALLEALDILKAAIGCLKKKRKPQQQQQLEDMDLVSELRRKRKKVEFFLSWSQHPEVVGSMIPEQLPSDVRAWAKHWKSGGGDSDCSESLDDSFLLSPLSTSTNKNRLKPSSNLPSPNEQPLLQERCTSRKIQFIE